MSDALVAKNQSKTLAMFRGIGLSEMVLLMVLISTSYMAFDYLKKKEEQAYSIPESKAVYLDVDALELKDVRLPPGKIEISFVKTQAGFFEIFYIQAAIPDVLCFDQSGILYHASGRSFNEIPRWAPSQGKQVIEVNANGVITSKVAFDSDSNMQFALDNFRQWAAQINAHYMMHQRMTAKPTQEQIDQETRQRLIAKNSWPGSKFNWELKRIEISGGKEGGGMEGLTYFPLNVDKTVSDGTMKLTYSAENHTLKIADGSGEPTIIVLKEREQIKDFTFKTSKRDYLIALRDNY